VAIKNFLIILKFIVEVTETLITLDLVILKITEMKNTLLVITSALCLVASPLRAQIGQQMALSHSPAYEAAAAPLRSAPRVSTTSHERF
jgi:hypothetical protein